MAKKEHPDLVMLVLIAASEAITLDRLEEKVNALGLLEVRPGTVKSHIKALMVGGYVQKMDDRPVTYARTSRTCAQMDIGGPMPGKARFAKLSPRSRA